MFRRLEKGLPKNPEFPADLKALGYFITETSEIRKIDKPDEYFQYWLTNNIRYNEMHKESMNTCIRKEVLDRLAVLGATPLYLPQTCPSKPTGPYVPILTTNPAVLRTRKEIIVVVNDDSQDLGIWAYRVLDREGGINGGSAVSLLKELTERLVNAVNTCWPIGSDSCRAKSTSNHSAVNYQNANGEASEAARIASKAARDLEETQHEDAPGVIILNNGQLLYSHRSNQAMTSATWHDRPRKTAVHPMPPIDPIANTVRENRNSTEHVQFVLKSVINNPDFVSPDARLYIIGLGNGGDAVVKVLNTEWAMYGHRVSAIALTHPTLPVKEITNPSFASSLANKARSWTNSYAHFGTPLHMPKSVRSTHRSSSNSHRFSRNSFREHLRSLPEIASDDCAIDMTTSMETIEEMETRNDSNRAHRRSNERRRASATDNDGGLSDDAGSPKSRHNSHSTHLSVTTDAQSTNDDDFLVRVFCPTFSSGVPSIGECIFPAIYKEILAWFEEVMRAGAQYRNPAFTVPNVEELERLEGLALDGTEDRNEETAKDASPAGLTPQVLDQNDAELARQMGDAKTDDDDLHELSQRTEEKKRQRDSFELDEEDSISVEAGEDAQGDDPSLGFWEPPKDIRNAPLVKAKERETEGPDFIQGGTVTVAGTEVPKSLAEAIGLSEPTEE